MTRILCLWLPNWAFQRAIRCRPELEGRPVVLVDAGARGGEVAACCRRAISQGVRPKMPLAEAQALLKKVLKKGTELFSVQGRKSSLLAPQNSSDPFFAAYNPTADRRALLQLAEACERFSPRVALEEGNEPESLLLDISNLEHLYGSETKLIGQVNQFFTRRGYRVRLAVAETVGAAWAAAHFDDFGLGMANCRLGSFQSRASRGDRNPQLPIEALRIAEGTTALLHELGIETVDQLLALPRQELTSRFGEELLRRLDQLTGRARELIEPHHGVPAFEASCVLEEPTGDLAVLRHVLEQLVDQLSRQLAALDQGAMLLVCLLRCTDGREVPLRIGLLRPSASTRQLLELIELHLENVRLADEVDRVVLRAAVAGRLGERQRDLFTDRWPTDPYQLASLVNRLSSRLGCERVLRAELRNSPLPERGVKWAPATEKRERSKQGDKEKSWKSNARCLPFSLSSCLPPRPLLLYPAPQPREVVCIAPDGPPQFVWVGKHREQIVGCLGPERIETLWWRGPSVRRDYYRVATQSGSHLWMFRRLADGRWFVHGEFD
jgi:protein ImuB